MLHNKAQPSLLFSSFPLSPFLPFSFSNNCHDVVPFAMARYILIHLLFFATVNADALLAPCYLPNGSTVPLSSAYQPCISTQNVHSMCCVLNVTALQALGEGPSNADVCLENGMCQTPNGGFARDLCTDPTWKSPNCLNICTDPSVSP
jgi:hypothetical protein